jgi:hypothetical protein
MSAGDHQTLASYRKLLAHGADRWTSFLDKRSQRLAQWQRNGSVAEKVAEEILEDLFTEVLDWSIADLNHQVDFADLIITQFGVKRLLVEGTRPNSLACYRHSVDCALDQARRYAMEQRVRAVAISDGRMQMGSGVAKMAPHPRRISFQFRLKSLFAISI